jgi:hypothetical protein
MPLSDEARNRIFIATTDRDIGTEIADAIDASNEDVTTLQNAKALVHEVMISPARSVSQPGQGPDPVVYNTVVLGHAYTLNTDSGFRMFKIPTKYVGNPSFHVHWTKSGNVSEATKAVKWRISYSVVNGINEVIDTVPTVIDVEDIYDATDTTDRVIYRTPDQTAVNVVAGYYLFVKVEAVTPAGVPLANEPVLISVDFRYEMNINK